MKPKGEEKMKKLSALLLVLVLCLTVFVSGCAKDPAPVTQDPPKVDDPAPVVDPPADPEPEKVDHDESWNDMTDDELYELALQEGGTITIYAITSRMPKTCDSFMEAYPGLVAEATDFDQTEATTKIEVESKSGQVNADILQCKDGNGEIYFDYFPLGYLETYYPTDICSHIDPDLLKYGMPFYCGLNYWYYNTEMYPDGPPVDDWWDIIELDEKGNNKFNIVCSNIGGDNTYLTFYANMILNADLMAASYEAKYGEPITYTYDASLVPGVPENNAGYEYLYRLSQAKMTFISDGDDIVEAVHASKNPTLGFASAGKITNRDENGWNLAWVTSLEPYTNMMNCNYVYLVKGSDNPAGSRLFIRYLMGGADGQGDGFKPFTKEGNWSIRDDYTNPNNPFSVEESGAITGDMQGVYDIFLDVKDFWEINLFNNPNM